MHLFIGQADSSQSLVCHIFDGFVDLVFDIVINRHNFVTRKLEYMGARFQHQFRGTLHQEPLLLVVLNYSTHHFSGRGERYGFYDFVFSGPIFVINATLFQELDEGNFCGATNFFRHSFPILKCFLKLGCVICPNSLEENFFHVIWNNRIQAQLFQVRVDLHHFFVPKVCEVHFILGQGT